ncbi:hypothetical protein D3C72_884080 [compost metagenome]
MTLHTQCQGADAAQRQEAAERIENAAHRVLQEAELLGQLWVIPHRSDTGDHVGMAVEVFGGGMHYHIKAEIQRTLDIRRGKGVVRYADQTVFFSDGGDGAQISQFQQWVGRRFNPDHFGIRFYCLFQPGKVRRGNIGDAQACGTAADLLQQAIGAAVQIVDRHQMATLIEQLQHR